MFCGTFHEQKKNADIFFFLKKRIRYLKQDSHADAQSELKRLKNLEQELMLEALGLKEKTHRVHGKLTKEDMHEALKRGSTLDEGEEVETNVTSEGVGFNRYCIRGGLLNACIVGLTRQSIIVVAIPA
jgi:hypothetical protein